MTKHELKDHAQYHGIRLKFLARLGSARVLMQVDVGFGDTVVPEPELVEVPTLLDYPVPKLVAYRRETTIAEKFNAMVELGTLNTRMKDFYDLWLLSTNYVFDGETLAAAINATFSARSTRPELEPIALTAEFADSTSAQRLWTAFLKKSALTDAPSAFVDVVDAIRAFVLPVLTTPAGRWVAGKGWR